MATYKPQQLVHAKTHPAISMHVLSLILLLCTISTAGQAQTKRYVDLMAMGLSNGTSWTNAYNTLQQGINACNAGDSLFVTGGEYLLYGSPSLVLKKGVRIYGGFTGTETNLGQRRLSSASKTVLQGNSNAVASLTGKVTGYVSMLDGFTITNGGGASYDGGAITMNNAELIIRNCIFYGNTGLKGGAIYSTNATYTVINCVFYNNSATEGGAIYNGSNSWAELYSCTFYNNTASNANSAGAVYDYNTGFFLSNCLFWANKSQGVASDIDNASHSVDDFWAEYCFSPTNIGGEHCIVSGTNPLANSGSPAGADGVPGTYDDGLRLKRSGAAVNAGDNNSTLPATDLIGLKRTDNGRVDIGAYETLTPVPDAAGILCVDGSQGNHLVADGKSWSTAIFDMALALDAARANSAIKQIWVAKGTYQPAPDSSFSMVEGVKMYGGFAGTETALTQRNLASGNNSVLKGNGKSVVYNRGNNLSTASLIDGFIITGGVVYSYGGAGMTNYESSPTVKNCVFDGNFTAVYGGGMFVDRASPVIINCIFSNNTAQLGSSLYIGAGTPKLINCSFSNNTTDIGGSIFINSDIPVITNCIFWGNVTNLLNPDIYGQSDISYSYTQAPFAGTGNITGGSDPFVNSNNPAGADGVWGTADDGLSLLFSSAVINAGTPDTVSLGLPAYTLSQKERVSGMAIDMGAYEYVIPAPDVNGIVYIDSSKANSAIADGKSWSTASADLPAALLNARQNSTVKQIWVAKGTYQPASGASFSMAEGVKMYGGFAATETSLLQRNLKALPQSILKGNGAGVINNTSNHLTTASLLDGFIITGGTGGAGGGMANTSSSPTISNCIFTGNNVTYGAGMYNNVGSDPVIYHCIFANNTGGYGAAIQNDDSGPVITNCTFANNTASVMGGALHLSSSSGKVTNCVFWNNTAPTAADINVMGVNNNTIKNNYTQTAFAGNTTGTANPFVSTTSLAGADGVWRTADDGLRLATGSTAINAGTPDITALGLPAVDITGGVRVYGGAIDAGAYETFAYTADANGVLYVNVGRTAQSLDDGRSWNVAVTNLTTALQAASADHSIQQIWVAKGTYQPANGAYFTMVEGVKIYGGFAGTEVNLAQRNLSGGFNSILKGNNHSVIYNNSNHLTAASVLDGFIITGGETTQGGGGMYNLSSSPSISNCIFVDNKAGGGGGFHGYSSASRIVNCAFIRNTATQGGGVFTQSGGQLMFINCTFSENSATGQGGAFTFNGTAPRVVNSILWKNTASTDNEVYLYSGVPSFVYTYMQGAIAGTGNKQNAADPFVNSADPAGADGLWGTSDDGLLLKGGSAAIDAGNPDTTGLGLSAKDMFGFVRFIGNSIDMGALERAASLPVKLLSFTGRLKERTAYLQWQTADEVNFQRFTLERSVDGISFVPVATVSAKGNNSQYTYQLPQPLSKAYYRLKMIDIDERYEYSRTLLLSQATETDGVSVYPNPAKELVYISVNNPATIQVYDLAGHLLKTQMVAAGVTSVDVSGWLAGVYMLQVNGKTIRFVKQ